MAPQHMDAVMAVQAACYHAIAPESFAAMDAKRVAGAGLSLVAQRVDAGRKQPAGAGNIGIETNVNGGSGSSASLQAEDIDAYLIALPVRWPNFPALNAEPLPSQAADTLYLHDLALHPRARGSGVATRLVNQVLVSARQAGLQQAALIAIQGSVPFWQRFGFAVQQPDPVLAAKLASYGGSAQLMRREAV